jgi:hypothetical protein
MELIKTYRGFPRMRDDRWLARVNVSYIYRCKKCGLYFWTKEDAGEHKHEMPNVRRVVASKGNP